MLPQLTREPDEYFANLASTIFQATTDAEFSGDSVAFMQEAGSQLTRRQIDPDPWQREVLSSTAKRKIICTGRQTGKSTVLGGLALYKALFEDESLVLLFAPTEKQAKELFAKIAQLYLAFVGRQEAEALNRVRKAYGSVGKFHLELDNGSRVLAMPSTEHTSRGYDPDLLIVDEAAFPSDTFYGSVTPGLTVSKGDLVLASTPHGKRGFFYDEWESRHEEGWDWWEINSYQCPRADVDFLDRQKRRNEAHWSQEFMCQFLETEEQVFSRELVERARAEDAEPLFSEGEVEDWWEGVA